MLILCPCTSESPLSFLYQESNFPFSLHTDSKGFPPLEPHELSFHHVALLYRLHWCGSNHVKQATHMNGCGCDSIWTPSAPEEGSLQLIIHSIWPQPLCFKQKATGQLEGSQGWDPASWLAKGHTCSLVILQPSCWNSDALTYSRSAGEKSRSMALCTLAIDPSTGRADPELWSLS